jgi:AcrR family transcriptional regulator
MVACVARKGFASTTVDDLVKVSGVSSRTFYDLFGDKPRCLHETVKAILAIAPGALPPSPAAQDFEQQARDDYAAFASAVLAQPAAARLCLIEAFAAGPEALEPLEAALAGYEREVLRRCQQSPGRAGMPRQLVAARLGGMLEATRARLWSGRTEELPELGPEVAALLAGDRPPPEPLRLSARAKRSRPEILDAPDHAERAIRALAISVAEHGYQATTVDQVVKLAGMSARTFYANFRGKEDVLGAAIDSACAQMVAAVTPAFSRQDAWPDAVRAGYGGLLGFLTSRPALARLVLVDAYAAGGQAIARRNRGLAPLTALLAANTTDWPNTPSVVFEVIAGGSQRLMYEAVRRAGIDALPPLAPILTYMTLLPFIGPEAACAAANGESGGRSANGAPARRWSIRGESAVVTPSRTASPSAVAKALTFLGDRWASPAEVAAQVGEEEGVVADFLRQLGEIGAIEANEMGGEKRYHASEGFHKLKVASTQQTAAMTPRQRDDLTRFLWGLVERETLDSIARGAFDSRPDRYFTRTPLRLDQEGWRELTELHRQTLQAGMEIQARSDERMEGRDAPVIDARSIQIAYEYGGAGSEEAQSPNKGAAGEDGESSAVQLP